MSKYILYGGSFNPLHNGHVNVVEELLHNFDDHQVIMLPAYQSPMKDFDYDPGIEHRFKMLQAAFSDMQKVVVDDYELLQNKKCFTVDVLPHIFEKYNAKDLKLVIGLDQLMQFQEWKNFEKILQNVSLVVVSRPGYDFLEVEELPEELLSLVSTYKDNRMMLNSGHQIIYYDLHNNYDVSSSKIRSNLRKGRTTLQNLPEDVISYLKENELYKPIKTEVDSFEDFTLDCFSILKEKNALGVLAYDVRNITQPSEFNLICSGTNVRQTSAIAENLIRNIKKKYALSPLGVEGLNEGRWVVIDYGSLIVHVFYDFIRSEYNLEELWSKGVLLKSEE